MSVNPTAFSKVNVTVDGKVYPILPGRYNMKDFERAIGSSKSVASLTITVAAPTQPATINGNDSFLVSGGETFVSVTAAK